MKFAGFTLVLAAVALVMLAAAGPAYRMGVSLPAAFTVLRWGAYAGLAAAVLGAMATLYFTRAGRRLAAIVAVAATLAGLIAFALPYSWQRRAQRVPAIHDISTDLENPPAFDAVVPLRADAPNTLERPADLADLQRSGYPDLAPITLSQPPERVFDRALSVAQESGWEIVTADRSSGRIEATDTTPWFGFKDDVVVRLTPWGSGTRVDVRSVSRVGRSDVGTNAARIEEYLERVGS